jgi:hypothetical protein
MEDVTPEMSPLAAKVPEAKSAPVESDEQYLSLI